MTGDEGYQPQWTDVTPLWVDIGKIVFHSTWIASTKDHILLAHLCAEGGAATDRIVVSNHGDLELPEPATHGFSVCWGGTFVSGCDSTVYRREIQRPQAGRSVTEVQP